MAYFAGSNVGFGEASRPKTSGISSNSNSRPSTTGAGVRNFRGNVGSLSLADDHLSSPSLQEPFISPTRTSPLRTSPLSPSHQPVHTSLTKQGDTVIRSETVRSLLGELQSTVTDYATAVGQPIHSSSKSTQGLRRPFNPSSVLSRPASSFGASRRNESRASRRGYSQEEIDALSEPFVPGQSNSRTGSFSKNNISQPPEPISSRSLAKLHEISKSSDELISALAVLKKKQNIKKGLDSSSSGGGSSSEATMSAPAVSFGVNNLKSKRGDTVHVYSDRAEYTFIHPFLSIEVDMVMFFRDMIGIDVRSGSQGGLKGPAGKTRITFRLSRSLEAFGADGASPSLYIEFVSPSVALRVYDIIQEALG
jgi:hypothetical protein